VQKREFLKQQVCTEKRENIFKEQLKGTFI
jgi:hypothetical protein